MAMYGPPYMTSMHPFGSRIRARDEDKPSLARAFVQCAPHAAVFFLGVVASVASQTRAGDACGTARALAAEAQARLVKNFASLSRLWVQPCAAPPSSFPDAPAV